MKLLSTRTILWMEVLVTRSLGFLKLCPRDLSKPTKETERPRDLVGGEGFPELSVPSKVGNWSIREDWDWQISLILIYRRWMIVTEGRKEWRRKRRVFQGMLCKGRKGQVRGAN